MTTEHSPEPWTGGTTYINDASNNDVVYLTAACGETEFSKEDIRRILACVNACTGIPTERLEGMKLAHAVEALGLIDKGGGNIDCESYCGVYRTLEKINDD